MTVEFGVLGGVWATRNGAPVDLGGHRQRSVIARLLTSRGAVVPADLLVADLWHAETPPRAQAALQAHISHLRRALEPDRPPRTPARLLLTVPPGYALRPDGRGPGAPEEGGRGGRADRQPRLDRRRPRRPGLTRGFLEKTAVVLPARPRRRPRGGAASAPRRA
jgi:hypothetical protein